MKKLFTLLAFAALLATSCQDILDVIDDLDDALGGSAPTGAVNGIFTVSEGGSAVYFSKGNLQYQASTKTWRFAENQWDYVIHKRSGSRYAPATVNGVHGLILLPDGWDGSAYSLSNVNLEEDWRNWGFNNISSSDWTGKLERAGAVFFPCAGQRGNINYPDEETTIGGTGPENILPFAGYYWSSTAAGQESAYNMQFGYHNSEVVTRYADYFCQGESVRLVADKK